MKTKQGFELREVAGLALVFLVIAIVISFGSTITDELQEEVTETGSATTVNSTQTGAFVNGTTVTLETYPYECSISMTNVYNGTGTEVLFASTDYSVSGCNFVWLADDEAALNLSYTATWAEGGGYNATVSGQDGLTTFADWLPTLALIVIAAVVIGIIVRYFAFSGAV